MGRVPLAGLLLEILEVDEDAGGQNQRTLLEPELRRLERHAEAISIREGFRQNAGPFLLDAAERAAVALEHERPRAPQRRRNREQQAAGGIGNVEALR